MLSQRNASPISSEMNYLCDGGLETFLIFQEGLDLPHFASFTLLETAGGRGHLVRYYERFLELARQNAVGFVLDTPTWRANPDWGRKLGYGPVALDLINKAAVGLIAELRQAFAGPGNPVVLNGVIGPRGDGYTARDTEIEAAEDYHAAQIAAFKDSEAEMVSAITMNSINEAIGITMAAKAQQMPCAVSFTVETNGRLFTGHTLRQAIEATDDATGGAPLYYMINCAHPSHFSEALRRKQAWIARIGGIRANASFKSHQELDESTTLDAGDPADLARRYANLRRDLPAMRVLGGCCGTDHRHVAAICEACLQHAA